MWRYGLACSLACAVVAMTTQILLSRGPDAWAWFPIVAMVIGAVSLLPGIILASFLHFACIHRRRTVVRGSLLFAFIFGVVSGGLLIASFSQPLDEAFGRIDHTILGLGLALQYSMFSMPPALLAPLLLRRPRHSFICPECSYDLRAHRPSQKCPECGTPIPPNPEKVQH